MFRDGGVRPPAEARIAFIDVHREAYGVEAISRIPADHPVGLEGAHPRRIELIKRSARASPS